MTNLRTVTAYITMVLGMTLVGVAIAGNSSWPLLDVEPGDHFSPGISSGMIAILAGAYLYLENRYDATEVTAAIALLLNAVSFVFNSHMIVHSANKVKYTDLAGDAAMKAAEQQGVTMSSGAMNSQTDKEALMIVMLTASVIIFILNLCAMVNISIGLYGYPFGMYRGEPAAPPAYPVSAEYGTSKALAILPPKRALSDVGDYTHYAGYNKPRY